MTYYYYKIKNMNVSFISAPNAVHQHYPIQPAGVGGGSPKSYTGPMRLRNVSGTEGTLTIKFGYNSSGDADPSVDYSIDGKSWTTVTYPNTVTIQVPDGGWAQFRSDGTTANSSKSLQLSMNVDFVAEGMLTSLSSKEGYEELTTIDTKFYNLFENASNLVDASGLSIGSVSTFSGHMNSMFRGCTKLTKPFDFSGVTTLGNVSYSNMFINMFYGCTSLVEPLATYNIANGLSGNMLGLMRNMYENCSNLSYAYTLGGVVVDGQEQPYSVYQSMLKNAGTSVTGDKIIYCPNQEVYDAYPKSDTHYTPSGWTVQVMQ